MIFSRFCLHLRKDGRYPCCHFSKQVKLTIELGSSYAQVKEILNQRNECSGGFFATIQFVGNS